MKQKISTLIEENIMRLTKRRAAEEGRPLSDLIQDALVWTAFAHVQGDENTASQVILPTF
jgi:hypothetical protein